MVRVGRIDADVRFRMVLDHVRRSYPIARITGRLLRIRTLVLVRGCRVRTAGAFAGVTVVGTGIRGVLHFRRIAAGLLGGGKDVGHAACRVAVLVRRVRLRSRAARPRCRCRRGRQDGITNDQGKWDR